ncbi:MAG: GDSL-type esterase/lipase family protein [Bacteroidales bacterium]|nr:GDSL-type esterase/lipase family protein [Bacteroidales bacterium]
MLRKITLCISTLCVTSVVQAQQARNFVCPISTDGSAEIHVSLPSNPSGRAVVCCPGGGYSHLAFQKEGTDWATFFNDRGIALITLKYRMPEGDLTLPLSDAYSAMRLVRDSAEVWHINPYDVGIMGSSAGGHLAATVSTHAPMDAAPNFSLLFYPVITMGQGTHEGSACNFLGENRHNPAMIELWSAEKQVKHYMTPPTLLLLSNDDRVVPPVENGVAYYSAMRNDGLDCTMHIYSDGGHGWGYADYFKYKHQMLNDLSLWLERLPQHSPNAVRVSCVGNSITHGHGIDMKSLFGYPAQMQQMLGEGYWVRNFGYSARTLMNSGNHPYMKENNWRMAQDFLPNIVVVKLGTNDTKPENWEPHANEFAADLQAMIDTLKTLPTHPRILLCTPLPAFKESWGIRDSIIVNCIIPTIRQAAALNEIEVIDLHSLVDDEKFILPDGIHPNVKGCTRMAEIIAERIKQDPPTPQQLKKLKKEAIKNSRKKQRNK